MEDQFPPVHLRIEGDVGRGRTFIRAADQLRLQLLNVLDGEGVTQGGIARRLDDGVYAYVRKYGDLQVIGIVADPASSERAAGQTKDRLAPNFLSGTVFGGAIVNDKLREFRPTPRTARLFNLPSDRHDSERLAVRPYSVLAEELTPAGVENASQYIRLKPSMYSGTMKKLVQLLMGYGKLDDKVSVYDTKLISVQTPYAREVASKGTQVRYDWRFHRTHGLTKSADNRWWLTQIFLGVGIHLMPLPLYSGTDSQEFRQAVEAAGDDEGLEALDLFGGLPTGESLPAPGLIESWVRAGQVIKGDVDAELADFYRHTWYGPWLGWAFNENGTEAHNTGWRTDPDKFQTGVHWSARFSVGAIRTKPTDALDNRARLKAAVVKIGRRDRALSLLIPALLAKADWASRDEVADFMFMETRDRFLEFDALQIQPVASASVSLGQVSSSRMYAPSRNSIQAKFYEPTLGLVSHDFRAERGANLDDAPETDATLHVFFINNSITALKAWIRPNYQPDTVSVNEGGPCIFDDKRSVITTSFDGSATGMYSSLVDERNISFVVESSYVSVATMRDTGKARVVDDVILPYISYADKYWEVKVDYETRVGGGVQLSIASAVPRDTRESYYIATRKINFGSTVTTGVGYEYIFDDIYYIGWRNFPGWTGFLPFGCAWSPNFPACWTLAEHPEGCGKVRHRAVWREVNMNSGECGVSSGSWLSPCANMDDLPRLEDQLEGSAETVVEPHNSELVVRFVSANIPEVLVTLTGTATGEDASFLGNAWFIPSPDDFGNYQNIHAYGNELGSATTVRYSRTIDDPPQTIYGSPAGLELREGNWVFVGVMNA